MTTAATSPVPSALMRRARQRIANFTRRGKLFFQILYRRTYGENAFEEAAALSYHTLFSLLPVFILVVLMLSMLSRGEKGGIDRQVQDFIYKQLRLDALTLADQSTGEAINLPELINKQIDHARSVVQNPLTGLIGFAVLVYGASKIMLVIESAFNRIYGAAKARSWSRRITLYWSVLTLGPLLMAGSLIITNTFYKYASSYAAGQALLAPATFLAGFCVSWVLMIVLYKVVPGTHVNWSSALLGGFFGALLWELAKNGFGLYVRTTVNGTNWYGTLALVPLFMFWVYVTWAFILLGLHIAYIHQYFPVLVRREIFRRHCNSNIADLHWVLPLGVLLLRRFHEGKPMLAHEAADALNLPAETAEQFLHGLQAAGIVHCIDTRGNGFALARPPETISAQALIDSAKNLCTMPTQAADFAPAAELVQTPALADLDAHTAEWYGTHTLADLAREEPRPSDGESNLG